jgi:hypothetical protein
MILNRYWLGEVNAQYTQPMQERTAIEIPEGDTFRLDEPVFTEIKF